MRIAILGSGYMAKAIVKGLLQSHVYNIGPDDILMINPVDPDGAKEFCKETGIFFGEPEELSKAFAVIACFKPQNLNEAMPVYSPYLSGNQVFLSILAGVEIATLEKFLPATPVVRLMPNLALSAGKSATAFALGSKANAAHAELCETLFGALGQVRQVEEPMISVVTALSGSGPAYFYYLAEAMTDAAVALGMERETAEALCKQTFLGTAALWAEDNAPPSEMRKRITSKKGTTEAALTAMAEGKLPEVILSGMAAAKRRSDELAEEMK